MKRLPGLFALVGNLGLLLVVLDVLPFGVRGVAALVLAANVGAFGWCIWLLSLFAERLNRAGIVLD